MKNSRFRGFLLLDFAVSFLILCLILSTCLQFQEATIADSQEAARHHSTLRKVSGAAAYLATYSLAGEKGSYYETHVISEEKLPLLPQIKKHISERLALDSLEVYLGSIPPSPPASKSRICVSRLVIYKQAPTALLVCGD